MDKPNILTLLREKTAGLHRQVEKRVAIDDMSDRSRYEALLRAFFGFYGGVETPLLQLAGKALPDASDRRKTAWLKQDLLALGGSLDSLQELPRAPVLACSSTGQAMGAMYVLEGATLGGGFIADHIKKTLDIGPENGGRFFNNYGDERPAMWGRFRERLSGFAGSENVQDDILAGAVKAFTEFDRWLEASL